MIRPISIALGAPPREKARVYTGCSGRCERNRREHVIRANPELFPLLSKEFAKDWLAIILISGMLNVVAWMHIVSIGPADRVRNPKRSFPDRTGTVSLGAGRTEKGIVRFFRWMRRLAPAGLASVRVWQHKTSMRRHADLDWDCLHSGDLGLVADQPELGQIRRDGELGDHPVLIEVIE